MGNPDLTAAPMAGDLWAITAYFNPADLQKDHYLAWVTPFFDAVEANIGWLEGSLHHLWHGDFHDRLYRDRYLGFKPFGFDPAADIALSDSGAWRWASEKPAMHRHLRTYFASRREDG